MWHFTGIDGYLRYGDGRKVVAGETLAIEGTPVLCERGLHAAEKILDACKYAPGPYIWWVELSGEVIHDVNKSVATHRKAIWGYDATEVLRKFARLTALRAVEEHWDAKEYGEFPEVALKYLKTGDESLRDEAREAVSRTYAASSVTYCSAYYAAYSAYYAAHSAYYAAQGRSAQLSCFSSAAADAHWADAAAVAVAVAVAVADAATTDAAFYNVSYASSWEASEKLLVQMIHEGKPTNG